MNAFNSVTFIGYLTRDAEHKSFPSGRSACTLSLAANRKFKNKTTNEVKEETCYIDAVTWGNQANWIKDLKKGNKLFIQGYLKFDTYQDKDGKKHSKHRIYADQIMDLSNREKVQEKAPLVSDDLFESDLPF